MANPGCPLGRTTQVKRVSLNPPRNFSFSMYGKCSESSACLILGIKTFSGSSLFVEPDKHPRSFSPFPRTAAWTPAEPSRRFPGPGGANALLGASRPRQHRVTAKYRSCGSLPVPLGQEASFPSVSLTLQPSTTPPYREPAVPRAIVETEDLLRSLSRARLIPVPASQARRCSYK
jgi:hypothetical protein